MYYTGRAELSGRPAQAVDAAFSTEGIFLHEEEYFVQNELSAVHQYILSDCNPSWR